MRQAFIRVRQTSCAHFLRHIIVGTDFNRYVSNTALVRAVVDSKLSYDRFYLAVSYGVD